MGELLDLPEAYVLSAHRLDEPFHLALRDPVHAHELPEGVHIRVDGKGAAEDPLPHPLAHLADQSQSHGDPRLAPRKRFGDLRDTHFVEVSQIVDKSRLFENAERLVVRGPNHREDPRGFVFPQ